MNNSHQMTQRQKNCLHAFEDTTRRCKFCGLGMLDYHATLGPRPVTEIATVTTQNHSHDRPMIKWPPYPKDTDGTNKITTRNLEAHGYFEAEGWWIDGDARDRDFSSDGGTDAKPILAFPKDQIDKIDKGERDYVQAHLFADWNELENDISLIFWKMTHIDQVRAWHVAHGVPLRTEG